jgi:hypothetical protein
MFNARSMAHNLLPQLRREANAKVALLATFYEGEDE